MVNVSRAASSGSMTSRLSLSPPTQGQCTAGGMQSPSIAASSCTSAGGGACGGVLAATPNDGSGSGGLEEDQLQAWVGLNKLGQDLEGLVTSAEDCHFYSDAEIIVAEGVTVPVHRCILAARSPFLRRIFAEKQREQQRVQAAAVAVAPPERRSKAGEKRKEPPAAAAAAASGGRGSGSGRVEVDLAELAGGTGKIGRQALMIVLGYFYGGKFQRIEEECSGVTCMDSQCPHVACWPVIEFLLELLFVGSLFQVSDLKSMAQDRLLRLLPKTPAENVLQIAAAAAAQQGCEALQEMCLPILARSNTPALAIEKSLLAHAPALVRDIAQLRHRLGIHPVDAAEDKRWRRVYKALDSDDVELMGMLLSESNSSVDSVYALHYAASYCDRKTLTELLDLGLGDVNLRDRYGYTVLHAATLRRVPEVVGLLLGKGASPLDTTPEGYTALQVSRRIARNIEPLESAEAREDWLRDRICVEILEQADRANPCPVFPVPMGERELLMRLLYLENRVAFARLLWPRECKVVLGLSQLDTTKEFSMEDTSSLMDLNKEPTRSDTDINSSLLQRVNALQRAIEVGHRFFPRCTAILNSYMDDGSFEHECIQNRRIPEDQLRLLAKLKRVTDDKQLSEAYQRDVEEHHNLEHHNFGDNACLYSN
ncbi:BTB/POZ domain and ankyrin repeat-containing protein NPR1 [Selaginella moellendorffii]|uniref:BTB/POZ domain and ankyrin repeat-containing protein NPR1 n=1 Tax=Selaginella moellendorffii TaxID=88036 RepID=UPI000D1CAC0B|nr:BTB/POZ domain and ankyrin repeat-containing protein NPR1 [Selaginella moellendorffii]|eukprot:XP_024522029.1 BTB/POZ domain and ankyrin repeat-containing protein NPR1 [Selaginella moellendorffii]